MLLTQYLFSIIGYFQYKILYNYNLHLFKINQHMFKIKFINKHHRNLSLSDLSANRLK
jgi:hypothetical protein